MSIRPRRPGTARPRRQHSRTARSREAPPYDLAALLPVAAALARQHGVEVRVSAQGAVVIKPVALSENGQPVDKRSERNRRYYEARRLKAEQQQEPAEQRLKASESVLNRLNDDSAEAAPLPLSPSHPLSPQTPLSPAHPHTPTPGHKRVREAGEAEAITQETQQPQTWTPDDQQKLVNRWFSRRDTTAWSKQEQKAWKAIPADAKADGLSVLEPAYTATQGDAFRYRRRDLQTLLNNWQGEIDRWRHFKAPVQSDVRPLQRGYEDPPFLTDDAAIFHPVGR